MLRAKNPLLHHKIILFVGLFLPLIREHPTPKRYMNRTIKMAILQRINDPITLGLDFLWNKCREKFVRLAKKQINWPYNISASTSQLKEVRRRLLRLASCFFNRLLNHSNEFVGRMGQCLLLVSTPQTPWASFVIGDSIRIEMLSKAGRMFTLTSRITK